MALRVPDFVLAMRLPFHLAGVWAGGGQRDPVDSGSGGLALTFSAGHLVCFERVDDLSPSQQHLPPYTQHNIDLKMRRTSAIFTLAVVIV